MKSKADVLVDKAKKEAKKLKAQGIVYDSKKYASINGFFPTSDIVLMSVKDNELAVLLILRKEYPYQDCWALPGGFMNKNDETSLDAAKRELKEETKLSDIYLEELCSFTKNGRDPRQHIANSQARVITLAYIALIDHNKVNAIAASDAKKVEWKTLSEIKELDLAFDHELIIEKAIERVRGKLNYSNIGFEFVDKKSFTIPELQTVFEQVLGRKLDRNNFRTKILKLGVLEKLNEKKQKGPGKPAPYYTVNLEKIHQLQGQSLF